MKNRLLFTAGLLSGLLIALIFTLATREHTADADAAALSRSVAAALDNGTLQTQSSQHPPMHASAPPLAQATQKLEERLARAGGSASDWQLLAQSYDALGRPEEAQRARTRAAQ